MGDFKEFTTKVPSIAVGILRAFYLYDNSEFLGEIVQEEGKDVVKYETFSEIFVKTYNVSENLKRYGINKRDFVGICGDNIKEWLITDFVCALNDYSNVGIHLSWPSDKIEYIISETKMTAVFVAKEKLEELTTAIQLTIEKTSTCPIRVIVILDAKEEDNITLEASKIPEAFAASLQILKFRDLLKEVEKFDSVEEKLLQLITEREESIENGIVEDENDPFTVMYTSGTSGYPKGVVSSKKKYLLDASANPFARVCSPPYIAMSYMSLAHGGDRGICWQTTFAGGKICMISSRSTHNQIIYSMSLIKPCFFLGMSHVWNRMYVDFNHSLNHYLIEYMKEKAADFLDTAVKSSNLPLSTDELLNALPDHESWGKLSSVLCSITGKKEELLEKVREDCGGRVEMPVTGGAHTSSMVLNWMAEVFAPRTSSGENQEGSKVRNSYGSTEFPGISSNGEINEEIDLILVDVPEMGYSTQDRPHPRGEIAVRHKKNLFTTSYFNNPEATAKAFKDGWYYTGDIGMIDYSGDLDSHGRGKLHIIDRKTNMIEMYVKGDSVWIEPAKLEDIFASQISHIHQIILSADRNAGHVIAIIVPKQSYLETWGENSENYFLFLEEIKLHFLELFQTVGEKFNLKSYEIPIEVIVEFKEWTVENGGLTPVGKLSRGYLYSFYKPLLDEIYANIEIQEENSGTIRSSSDAINMLRSSVEDIEKVKHRFMTQLISDLVKRFEQHFEEIPVVKQNVDVKDFLDFVFEGPTPDITESLNTHLNAAKEYVKAIRNNHKVWKQAKINYVEEVSKTFKEKRNQLHDEFHRYFFSFSNFISTLIEENMHAVQPLDTNEEQSLLQNVESQFRTLVRHYKLRKFRIQKSNYLESQCAAKPNEERETVMRMYAHHLDIVQRLADRVKVRVPYQIWAHGWWRTPGAAEDDSDVQQLNQSLGSAEVFCEITGEQIERDVKDVGIVRYHCQDDGTLDRTYSAHHMLESIRGMITRFLDAIIPKNSPSYHKHKRSLHHLYSCIDRHASKYWYLEKAHYWHLRTNIDKHDDSSIKDTPASVILNALSTYSNRLCLGIPDIPTIFSSSLQSLSTPNAPLGFTYNDLNTSLSHLSVFRCPIAEAAGFEFVRHNNYLWLTYEQIRSLVVRVAKGLLSIGLKEGEFVGLCGYNTIEWMVCDFACSIAGLVSVGLHTTNNNRMAAFIATNCKLSAIITVKDHLLAVDDESLRDVHWSVEEIIQSSPSITKIISMDISHADILDVVRVKRPNSTLHDVFSSSSSLTFHSLIDFVAPLCSNRDVGGDDDEIGAVELKNPHTLFEKPNEIVTLFYTSGTSGVPKGVIVTAENFYNDISERVFVEPLVTVSYIPLSHSSDRLKIWEFLAGGGRVGFAYFSASNWLSHEREKKSSALVAVARSAQIDPVAYIKSLFLQVRSLNPTAMSCPPNIWNSLYHFHHSLVLSEYNYRYPSEQIDHVDRDTIGKIPLHIIHQSFAFIRTLFGSNLQTVITGGAPTPPPIYEFMKSLFPSIRLADSYGATECGGILENGLPLTSKGVKVKLHPIPSFNSPLLGEIIVKSPNASPGYYGEEEKTKEVFRGKWYHTGDVGKLVFSSGKNSKYKVCGRVFSAVPFGENKVLFPGNLEAVFESSSKIQQIFLYVNAKKTFSGVVLPSTFCVEENEEYFRKELLCIAKEFQLDDYEIPSRLLIEKSILWEQSNGFLSPQFKKLHQRFVAHYNNFLNE